MPEKSRTTTIMDTARGKQSEKLHKSLRQYFYHILWSLWNEIISKNSVLVVSLILRLIFKILSPDNKYSLSVKTTV